MSADLDTEINRAILKATESDASRTKKEKLFKYRCEIIARHIGFADDPTGSATKYSCDVLGVGIALYAGKDLGKHSPETVGKYFVDKLAAEGLEASLFIEPNHPHGTSMAFYINGESWRREAVDPLEAADMVVTLATEAKLILLNEGRIQGWPK